MNVRLMYLGDNQSMKKISIIGFGKIGQAIAGFILRRDWQVVAVDNNPDLVKTIRQNGFQSTEPGLQDLIQPALQEGRLTVTDDYNAIRRSNAVIICIPLGIDAHNKAHKEPFLNCVRQIAAVLSKGTVVIVETSVPVGFCRNDIALVLEAEGLQHGNDFFLAASPERIKSGTMLKQLESIPKVIGGYDVAAGNAAMEIYSSFFGQGQLVLLQGLEAAEFMKLAGMIYRDVNIALSNQLAAFANSIGANFVDLLPLINADGEAGLLQPGIGVAGHCTPVYPWFLVENFKQQQLEFTLAKESRHVNESMPAYAASLLMPLLEKKKVLILGLAFRPGVKEDARSIAYPLRDLFLQRNVEVLLHDPCFSAEEISAKGFLPCNDIYNSGAEAVVIVTMHAEYHQIDWQKMASSGIAHLIDGRNQADASAVEAAGISYQGIGK